MAGHKTDRVAVTKAIRAELRAQQKRTGVGSFALMRGAKDKPEGVSQALIENWIHGRSGKARRAHLDYVLERWRSLPDWDAVHMSLTNELRQSLRAQIERTGVGIRRLLEGCSDVPEGLNEARFKSWLTGKIRTARQEHVAYVLERWAALPTMIRVAITPDVRDTLKAHMDRTGQGPQSLLRGAQDKPEGLNAAYIDRWTSEKATSAREDYLAYVLERWAALPDKTVLADRTPPKVPLRKPRPERMAITEEIRKALHFHRERTGHAGCAVLADRDDVPAGLNARLVDDWMTGRIRTARKAYLAYVLERWAALPDTLRRIELTDDIREGFRAHMARTGTGIVALLKDQGNVPDGLNDSVFHSWFTPQVKTARKDHVDYLNAKWRDLAGETAQITESLRQALTEHRERTGKGPSALLRGPGTNRQD